MGDIKAIIARLEAASEGSHELDAHIQAIEHNETFVKLDDGPCGETHALDQLSVCWLSASGRRYTCWGNKAYTRSLDAALTLVPEDAVWHVMTDYGDLNRAKVGPRNQPYASVYSCDDRPMFVEADADTPPLALCIAALKARLGKEAD